MTAKEAAVSDNCPQGPTLPDRCSAQTMVAALRNIICFHEQMGITTYPLPFDHALHLKKVREVAESQGSGRRDVPDPAPCRQQSPSWSREKAAEQLLTLYREIEACQGCALSSARQGVATGNGTVGSPLLVVGDYSDQCAGLPFAPATLFGQGEDAMLWNMMRAIGLSPAEVYVTNAIKCCPLPDGRPGSESVQGCREYLRREIGLVRPRVICAMGELAAQSLLGEEGRVLQLRGRFHPYRATDDADEPLQVMVTFHPRFLLKKAEFKQAAWQDLQMIQRHLLHAK